MPIKRTATLRLWLAAIIFTGMPGCESLKEVERATVRDIVFTKQPPPIQETLPATVTDSVVFAFRTEGKDTVLDIRYYPLQARFMVKLRPDSVLIVAHDTLASRTEHAGAIVETAVRSRVSLLIVSIIAAVAVFLLNL